MKNYSQMISELEGLRLARDRLNTFESDFDSNMVLSPFNIFLAKSQANRRIQAGGQASSGRRFSFWADAPR